MLHPLIYQGWTPPDHVCLIIHGAAAAPLAQPLCPWQPLPPPCFHPKHVTTHAKLCQPPATSLGGDCLQVVGHLVVVTAHRAPDFQPLTHFAQVAAIHSMAAVEGVVVSVVRSLGGDHMTRWQGDQGGWGSGWGLASSCGARLWSRHTRYTRFYTVLLGVLCLCFGF